MNRTFFIVAIIIAVALIGLYLLQRGDITLPADTKPRSADSIFGLTFLDYEGNEVSLNDFKGKPLVVNSWAAWCPFCKNELPDFASVQNTFGDQVVIVAIDRAESLETAKKYSDEIGVTDKLIFWLDSGDNFYEAIGGFSMPETVFIDKDGLIQFHKRGPMKVPEITKLIQDNIL
jgi:thiol-disulfide isomerase/thioredoxin